MSQKIFLLTFKGICMNFLLELNFFILSHPVTFKQPRKTVQIHMTHPVISMRSLKDTCDMCIVYPSPYSPVHLRKFESSQLLPQVYLYFLRRCYSAQHSNTIPAWSTEG